MTTPTRAEKEALVVEYEIEVNYLPRYYAEDMVGALSDQELDKQYQDCLDEREINETF